MYSVIMATMLTSTGGSTGFGHHVHHCQSGYGHVYTCSGSACYGGGRVDVCSGWQACHGVPVVCPPAAQQPSSRQPVPHESKILEEIRKINQKLEGLNNDLKDLKTKLREKKVISSLEEGISPNRVATITVTLPSEARLWVDDKVCPLTSAERSFNTSPLEPGEYFFILRMEVERNGQMVRETRRIDFKAGEQMSVDFNSKVGEIAQR